MQDSNLSWLTGMKFYFPDNPTVKSVLVGQIEVSSQNTVSRNHHLTVENTTSIKITHKNIFKKKKIIYFNMYIRNIILKIQDCVLQCGSKVLLKLCLILIWVSFFGVRFEVGGELLHPPPPSKTCQNYARNFKFDT